jgi:DNA-binding transcriptional ArsR family regulator
MKKSSNAIIKAISNRKRLEILEYIKQETFVIKSDILKHFDLKRASLDFHLAVLEEAGLIGIKEIKMKARKYVFIYQKADWEISITETETALIQDLLPSKISEDDFGKLTDSFWVESKVIKDPKIIKNVLSSFAIKMGGEPTEYLCERCGIDPGIMKCSKCHLLFCIECAKIINKTDGRKVVLCFNCIANQFS